MKKSLFHIAVLAGLTTITSCDDFLTPENKSSVTDVEFFATADNFQSLVYDSYAQVADIFNSSDVASYFNAGTDLYCDGRNRINEALHQWQNFTPETGTVKDFYQICYDAIRSCLSIQYYAPNARVDEKAKNTAIDEGRFIAALHYYLLVCNYGGVPLVKEYASGPVNGYPRATAEETYAYIIDELTSIISNNNLPATTATAGGGRASIEAAKALLAKTYLAAAWDLKNNEYYNLAIATAQQVIDASDAKGLPDEFIKLWAANCSGDDNAEFIFDVEYDRDAAHDSNSGNRWQSLYCNYYGGSEEGMKNGSSSFVPTMRMLKLFTKEDKRFEATFMRTLLTTRDRVEAGCTTLFKAEDGKAIGDYFAYYQCPDCYAPGKQADVTGHHVGVYYPAYWETLDDIKAWRAEDAEHRTNTFVIPQSEHSWDMEPWGLYLEGGENGEKPYSPDEEGTKSYEELLVNSWSAMPCRKFDDAADKDYDAGDSFRDLHVISLPEMYFVIAEAHAAQNQGSEAAEALNVVRNRAGLAPLSTATVDDVLDESAREMFGNGYRRMDLRRTGKLVEYNNLYNPQLRGNAQREIGDKLLWPIPQTAIDTNGEMTSDDQNPGY